MYYLEIMPLNIFCTRIAL